MILSCRLQRDPAGRRRRQRMRDFDVPDDRASQRRCLLVSGRVDSASASRSLDGPANAISDGLDAASGPKIFGAARPDSEGEPRGSSFLVIQRGSQPTRRARPWTYYVCSLITTYYYRPTLLE